MDFSFSYAKAWFIFSLAILSFGYGFASHAWNLFPRTYMEQAWRQGRQVLDRGSTGEAYFHRKVYDRAGAEVLKPGQVQPGVTAITSRWERPDSQRVWMRLVDKQGSVLHEWPVDRMQVFDGGLLQRRDPGGTDIHGSLLLPDGDVVINLTYVGMARLNSCGEVQWTLTEGNHHSITRAEDGSFWVPGASQQLRTGTKEHPDLPGLESIWLDRILHVSGKGTLLKDIKVVDILYANDLERFLFQHDLTKGDVTHINDVEPLSPSLASEYPLFEAGDLLVSLRHINLVFVFDPESLEVKWHVSDPFIWQHDPDFIGDGWIGIFDNNRIRGKTEGGSRIIAFRPHTNSKEVLFRGKHLERFYTRHRGKWQMLENGNLLLTEEEAGRTVEVSPSGKPVWEWVHEPHGSRVPSVTKATRHDLTRQEIASWPCSSVDSDITPTQSQ